MILADTSASMGCMPEEVLSLEENGEHAGKVLRADGLVNMDMRLLTEPPVISALNDGRLQRLRLSVNNSYACVDSLMELVAKLNDGAAALNTECASPLSSSFIAMFYTL